MRFLGMLLVIATLTVGCGGPQPNGMDQAGDNVGDGTFGAPCSSDEECETELCTKVSYDRKPTPVCTYRCDRQNPNPSCPHGCNMKGYCRIPS